MISQIQKRSYLCDFANLNAAADEDIMCFWPKEQN